jgi:UDP-GlcNAc:undecaprenyl-phosphate/decaprenyl-phosphate GlcNAc-1-phosphate transferase
MMTMLIAFGLSLFLGLIVLALLRANAAKLGFLDNPDGRRKLHASPVAVVGGIGVFITVMSAIGLLTWFDPSIADMIRSDAPQLAWTAFAGCLVVVLGGLDDRFNLRARYKLLGQILGALVLVLGGKYIINGVSLLGYSFEFGAFAIPMTVLWFLAAMNAMNLLDGMDGQLGTLSLIMFSALAFLYFYAGNSLSGYVAVIFAGSLLAFLSMNFPPAKIYMGDAGSMFLGLIIAALAIRSSLKGAAVSILAPMTLLVLPFLDTLAAILRRKLTGRSLAVSDRAHLHHILLKRGLSIPQALLVVAGFGLVGATGAVFSVLMNLDWIALLTAMGVVAGLIATGLFGRAETKLVKSRVGAIFNSAMTRSENVEMEVRLQGTIRWEHVWEELTKQAATLSLTGIQLDVNAPIWHEGYHRRWHARGTKPDPIKSWRVELPLLGHGQVLGRLLVFGDRGEECIGDKLLALSELTKRVEQLAAEATLEMAEASSNHTVVPQPPTPTPLATKRLDTVV